jgi:hypothetical protein
VVPVLDEAFAVIEDIRDTVGLEHYVIPARRPSNPPTNTRWREYPEKPSSPQAIWRTVADVAERAGVAAHMHPHLLRHAFEDHVAEHAGPGAAQSLLGHANVDTTDSTCVDAPGLDELAVSVHGFAYRGYTLAEGVEFPVEATTGIEPVYTALQHVVRWAVRESNPEPWA